MRKLLDLGSIKFIMIMFDRISIERLFQSPPNTDNDHNVFSDSCIFLVYMLFVICFYLSGGPYLACSEQ